MEWSKGFTAAYYLTEVDPQSWRSAGRIEVISGQVSRTRDALMQSADLTCRNYSQTVERWIRVYMDTRQANGAAGHVALFTGLATSPKTDYDGNLRTNGLTCYSVLKPAADILLPRGWYALAGQNGGELVRSLLAVGPAPVEVDEAPPALTDTIIAEDGETNLSMAQKILTAMGWRLRIGGEGNVLICPMASEPVVGFGAVGADSIEPQLSVTEDYFSCPNVFRAVIGDQSAVAADDSPNSMLSTINRGREVWEEELSPVLAGGESLQAYARRRLAERQIVASVAQYNRRFYPDVYPGDLILLGYPKQRLSGVYLVTDQTITLGYGAQTSETVAQIRATSDMGEAVAVSDYLITDIPSIFGTSEGDRITWVDVRMEG